MRHILQKTISTRNGFIMVLAILVIGGQEVINSQSAPPNQQSAADFSIDVFYDAAIHSLIWIPNRGSGVLMDAHLKLAVTNAHVVGELEEVDVVFPARNRYGRIIEERSFYLRGEHDPVLRQLGFLTSARIVAKDHQADIALLELDGVPQSARGIEHDFSVAYDMNRNTRIHVFGNPGSQKLWRWTAGFYQGIDGRGMLQISADTYGGNSGGPVLNDQGMLIGIVTLSNELTTTWAVPTRRILDLLVTLRPRLIVSIMNGTDVTIPYGIKWTEDADWGDFIHIPAHKISLSWTALFDIPEGYPKIRFDRVADDGEFTEQIYSLAAHIRKFGVAGVPGFGPTYRFEYTPATKVITLRKSEGR